MVSTAGDAGAARARNRWGQGERLRTEILEAASRLLGELGTVDGLTLRGVARRVGIAPASIYAHFADKAGLIAALLEYEAERVDALLRDAVAGIGADDPVARVRAQVHAFCRYSLANPGHYRVMFGIRPSAYAVDRSSARLLVDALTDGMLACARAGVPLRLEPDRAAAVVLLGAHGRVTVSHTLLPSDTEERVIEFADDLLALVIDRA